MSRARPGNQVHRKKRLATFPSPTGMSLTKLALGGNNLITPAQGESGKWHPGWGRECRQPFFYSVDSWDFHTSDKLEFALVTLSASNVYCLRLSWDITMYTKSRRRSLRGNPDKSLQIFPPCYSKSPLQLCLEISISSNSRNLLQFLYRRTEESLIENHTPFPIA